MPHQRQVNNSNLLVGLMRIMENWKVHATGMGIKLKTKQNTSCSRIKAFSEILSLGGTISELDLHAEGKARPLLAWCRIQNQRADIISLSISS